MIDRRCYRPRLFRWLEHTFVKAAAPRMNGTYQDPRSGRAM